MRLSSAFIFLVTTLGFFLSSTSALADSGGDTECGQITFGSLSLVECANPNDSPGPYTPPPVTLFVVQDSVGVTAELADGTVIDIDPTSSSLFNYKVNGVDSNAADVVDQLDATLTEDEQSAISEALSESSTSDGTDELVDLLAD